MRTFSRFAGKGRGCDIPSRPKPDQPCSKRRHDRLSTYCCLFDGQPRYQRVGYCSASPCCEISSPSSSCCCETRNGTKAPTSLSRMKVIPPDHTSVTATP